MSLTLFKYDLVPENSVTITLSNAQVITGYKSAMWIERYREAGEFKIVAPVSSGLRTKLPLKSFISHTATQELMIVESHEISEAIDGDVDIIITGRSFESFLEQRIIGWQGLDLSFPPPPNQTLTSYTFGDGAGNTWSAKPQDQAVTLIEHHCYVNGGSGARFSNLRAASVVPGSIGTASERELKLTDVYRGVMDLLAIDDLGIKSVRASATSGLPTATDVGFIIHAGTDRSTELAFSHASGDIQNAQYLWTTKKNKTSVVVDGPLLRAFRHVSPAKSGLDYRAGRIDMTNQDFTITETTALNAAGDAYLGANNESEIVRAEITPTSNTLRYRIDYDVGDKVSVSGNYDTSGIMRIVEHVEIIDETGQSSYPTLEAV